MVMADTWRLYGNGRYLEVDLLVVLGTNNFDGIECNKINIALPIHTMPHTHITIHL